MPQNRQAQFPDIVDGHMTPPTQSCPGFPGHNQVQRRPRSGTPGHEGFHELRSVRLVRTCCPNKCRRVFKHVVSYRNTADHMLEFPNGGPVDNLVEHRIIVIGNTLHNAKFFGMARILDHDVEQEPVQLRFR